MMIIFYRKTGERSLSSIELNKNEMQKGKDFSTITDFKWIPIRYAKHIAEMAQDEIYVVNSAINGEIQTGIYKDSLMSDLTGIRSRHPNIYGGGSNKKMKPGKKFLIDSLETKVQETLSYLYVQKYHDIPDGDKIKDKVLENFMPSPREMESLEKEVRAKVKERLKKVVAEFSTLEELGAVKEHKRIEKEVYPMLTDNTGELKEQLSKARAAYLLALSFGNEATIDKAISELQKEVKLTMEAKAKDMNLKSPEKFVGIVGEDDEILMDPNCFEGNKNPISVVTAKNRGRAIYENEGLFVLENNSTFMSRHNKNIEEKIPKKNKTNRIESILEKDTSLVPDEIFFPIKASK